MKRQILPLLATGLALALTACGGQAPQAAVTEAPASTEVVAAPANTTTEATAAPAVPVTTAAPAPSSSSAAQPTNGGRLQTIISRGNLICGVNNNPLPGFASVDSAGAYTGFDIDFCKAIAAAIFDDPSKVEYRPLSAQDRFTALATGEIDVLIRNSTFTLSRDGAQALDWSPTTFYDGQGMMVRKADNINSLEDLNGATICVQTGTTTELNLTDQFKARGLEFTPVVFQDGDGTRNAYDAGQCDGFTTDKSGLVSSLSLLKNPDEHKILDVTMSKEPLGPAVLQGDAQWADAVRWIVYATFQAEEFGMNSTNLGDFTSSDVPEIQRFLGLADNKLGEGVGLSNDFVQRVIKAVGNYEEIY
ncbi:MAG: amino acid ABC transporter substrate-binding protein, partial [Oscillochloris sp.]|nr:amino acid ABC transporter substrate-binding protein [Oscillochloris sp.]